MEEDQELKHVCKFCKKSFPCGRSLGGHTRSHMRNTSTMKLTKRKLSSSVNGESNNNNHMVSFEAGGHAGYGLRENPKKNWRFSDSIDGTLRQGKVCRECGKGFQSWKALFDHMRCHSESETEKIFQSLIDDSWIGEDQKLVMDSQSDNEAAAPDRRRRSRRTRYNATSTSRSFANASASSVSEIEQEPEEVAMCLMMLSRDVGCWGRLNSVVESSDNNSDVFEARSLQMNKRIIEKEGKNFVCNVNETVMMKKPRGEKLELRILDSGDVRFERKKSEFGGSGSGFWRNGIKKVESEVSADGFIGDDESKKKPKVDDETELEVSHDELGKNFDIKNSAETLAILGKDFIKEADDQGDLEFGKYNSSKKTRYDTHHAKIEGDSCKKMKYNALDSPRKSKYKCLACNKVFHSYQALGGHRASHKKVKGCFASRIEGSENSIETEVSPDPTGDSKLIRSCKKENPVDLEGMGIAETNYGLKNSKHECPICLKVFTSGQALGGHKRSHLVGGSEARGSQTIVMQQQLPEIHDLLDLNLPAPSEEGTSGSTGFKPWWVGSNHRHEQLVDLISN